MIGESSSIPTRCNGFPVWSDRLESQAGVVQVRFIGRGPESSRGAPREDILGAVESAHPELAWAKQTHSARVLEIAPGFCGEGDALVGEPVAAPSIITADCVPILVACGGVVGAIHAGWRGIVAGVVGKSLSRMKAQLSGATAWIGPGIGRCCYEVGEEVAQKVVAASGGGVAMPGAKGRPHLDLVEAVKVQLATAGVGSVRVCWSCTRCNAEELWSYRRCGPGAGRNLAAIWLSAVIQ